MTTTTPGTIDARTTVGEIAIAIPSAARVFESRKIDYCCHGDTPLADACARAGTSPDEILRAIESAATPAGPSDRDWSAETLTTLTDHIVATHHAYTREEVHALPPLAEKVRNVHGANHPELTEVHRIVTLLEPELFQHMMKEEQILFPFVTELEAAVASGQDRPTPFFGTVRNPISMMQKEHDAAGDMLAELRRLTSGYRLPEGACHSYESLLTRLVALEEDLHFHIHLENNIYFPRAIDLEGQIEE